MISDQLSTHIYSKSLPNHNRTSHSPRLDLKSQHSLHFAQEHQTLKIHQSSSIVDETWKFFLHSLPIIFFYTCFRVSSSKDRQIVAVQKLLNNGKLEL
jgi:hypothetical protein